MINIAINGFGRIGRLVLRAGINDPALRFVAINDLTDAGTLAHLLRYDSVHGPFQFPLTAYGNYIQANGQDIKVFAEKEPEKLPWKALGVDVVVESTGIFTTKDGMEKHLKAGAKKVLLSAPPKDEASTEIKTIVMGVNEHTYKGEALVSNASCTTNCFAPMAKVISDNYGIRSGVMVTVHAYTADQRIVDSPHKDLRRAKSAALNICPTSTGAAKAIGLVVPGLKGRLVGSAIRVPVADGSLCNFVAEIETLGVTRDQVNQLFRNVSNYHMKGILEYSEESLVSSDIIGNPHSCVFDSQLTAIADEVMLSITGWYDNEWGYSNRVLDLIKYIMSH
jgi:glyceraldehyde 3-phosphate dehydrogenase